MTVGYHHFRSEKFPIEEGEDDLLVNPGLYGHALSKYLAMKFSALGYKATDCFAEDWGWYLNIDSHAFLKGLCVYSKLEGGRLKEFSVCLDVSVKRWSFSKFRYIDYSRDILEVNNKLAELLMADEEIEYLGEKAVFPFD